MSGERGDGARVRGRTDAVRGHQPAAPPHEGKEDRFPQPAARRADASALVWPEPWRPVAAEYPSHLVLGYHQASRLRALGLYQLDNNTPF